MNFSLKVLFSFVEATHLKMEVNKQLMAQKTNIANVTV